MATNGDTAQRFETTVTMNPKAVPNRPPTVGVAASASTCHPLSPTQPCTVTCTASASDPDGDALNYAWSGCASGGGASATCTVSTLSAVTCSVNVSDGRGGTATGSATVTGVNHAPVVTYYSLDPAPCGTGTTVHFGYEDADGDTLSYASGGVVSGPCTVGEVRGYPIGAIWVVIQTPPSPQSCQVWASAWDSGWQAGSDQAQSPTFIACQ